MTTPAQAILLKHASESDLQKLVVDYLRTAGFIVLETGNYTHTPGSKTVNDIGLSDLVIHDPVWPQALNCCIELKKPGKDASTRLDPDTGYSQAYLESQGATAVCHSLEEVLAVLEDFKDFLP